MSSISNTLASIQKEIISSVREFNRFYTAILGVANNRILGSDYSFTEARIIHDVASSGAPTAREIAEKLQIDEGYMSRIMNRFVKNGILTRKQSADDKRVYTLRLTAKGEALAKLINQQSDKQVIRLIAHLSKGEQQRLVALVTQVKMLLSKNPVKKQ